MAAMNLDRIVKQLGLTVRSAGDRVRETEVKGGYASDLLSDVIANAKEGSVWVTLQTHANILAVAKLKDLAAIVLVNKRKPDADTLERAEKENIVLLESSLPAFELVGKLYEMGIRGIEGLTS
jgi:hypothetical protein